jgi:hypothetical protein
MDTPTPVPTSVTAPVQSAVSSKINWIAGLSTAVVVLNETTNELTQLLPFVPEKYKHYVTVGIVVLGGLATIIVRTFFTTTVTPSSAKGM